MCYNNAENNIEMKKGERSEQNFFNVKPLELLDDSDRNIPLWQTFYGFFTLGLLWMLSLFSFFFFPVLLQVGSSHSYFGDKIEGEAMMYLYVVSILYTIFMTVYIGLRGYGARFGLIVVFNTLVALIFIASTGMTLFWIFYP